MFIPVGSTTSWLAQFEAVRHCAWAGSSELDHKTVYTSYD